MRGAPRIAPEEVWHQAQIHHSPLPQAQAPFPFPPSPHLHKITTPGDGGLVDDGGRTGQEQHALAPAGERLQITFAWAWEAGVFNSLHLRS